MQPQQWPVSILRWMLAALAQNLTSQRASLMQYA